MKERIKDLKSYKKPAEDSSFVEPPSAASEDNPPMYPYNNITATASGHIIEFDDTPKGERIRLKHRSGTFIEMHPDGDEVHKIYGDGYEITVKNKNVHIGGVCNITIVGDALVNYQGNRKEIVGKDYSLVVKGDYTVICEKELVLHSEKNLALTSSDTIKMTPGGKEIDGHVHISSDLEIDGHVQALSVVAERIDAKNGLSAGELGVFSMGPITSLISVTSPLAYFGISRSLWMTDFLNKRLHNIHFHWAPHGYTSRPIPGMV